MRRWEADGIHWLVRRSELQGSWPLSIRRRPGLTKPAKPYSKNGKRTLTIARFPPLRMVVAEQCKRHRSISLDWAWPKEDTNWKLNRGWFLPAWLV